MDRLEHRLFLTRQYYCPDSALVILLPQIICQ